MSMRKVVLVADDYPDSADLLCHLLEIKGGYETLWVDNGRDAVARCGERRIDIAILDFEMPELDGLAAAQRIREMLGDARPMLIALTGRAYMAEVSKSGTFDRVFEKPVSGEDLFRALEGAIGATGSSGTTGTAEDKPESSPR